MAVRLSVSRSRTKIPLDWTRSLVVILRVSISPESYEIRMIRKVGFGEADDTVDNDLHAKYREGNEGE